MVFQCESLDENGFVVDFGNLKFLRDWIDENLDHACLLSEDDPEMDRFVRMQNDNLIQITTVNNASCEKVAKHIFDVFDEMIRSKTSQKDLGIRELNCMKIPITRCPIVNRVDPYL